MPKNTNTLNDLDQAVYKRLNAKKYWIILFLLAMCSIAGILDILTAASSPEYRLSTQEVLRCLLNPGQASSATYVIVMKMRLPISLMALEVGFSLGTAYA